MTIHDILLLCINEGGSDIHLMKGVSPIVRVHGVLRTVEQIPPLNQQQAEELILPLMTGEQKDFVLVNKEIDFGYQLEDKGRFRANVYYQQGTLAAALRLIPNQIKSIDDLFLPQIFHDFTKYKQGLVLVTGPTGEGKSTTLAAVIEEINNTRAEHILTIEDPIEFVYVPKKSIISQREVNHDTHGWDIALRSALREDPDVVLVGEMRDHETIAAALTAAETGQLVFATLHTNTASQTVDRIIDVFPAHQQGQVRQQLASSLMAVVSQRLLPSVQGGRIAGLEVMVANSAIRNLIRESKIYQIDNVIQTSADVGNMLFETHLAQLVQRGAVAMDKAKQYVFRPDEFERLTGGR
jgi:twitching motility protein PilT